MTTRFDFLAIAVIVNGVEITGFSDGDDAITAKRRNDAFTDKIGADGFMMISASADKSGEVTLKLQQTSPSNAYLLDLFSQQETVGGFFQPINILIADTYNQDKIMGSNGYIKSLGDVARGKEGNDQEWVIIVERYDLLLGASI